MPEYSSPAAHADVVIIGGGVMGVSAAYHLATRGARVTVLEAEQLFGTGSTALNAGGFRHQFSTAVNIELSKLSLELLGRFEEEFEQPIGYNPCGYLFLLDADKDVTAFRDIVKLQHAHGINTQWLAPDDVARLAPQVNLDGILAATFYEKDGLVDPSGILQGYVRGASRAGATLRTGVRVTGARVENGRIEALQTTAGDVSGGTFLLAAGPWSGEVGRAIGVDVPVVPIRRQIAVTSPIPGLTKKFPFVIDFSQSLYFHYEGGAILTGMSNRDEPPAFNTAVDETWREQHVEAAMRRLPLLGESEIAHEWAGLYEVTPDDQAIIGRLPQLENLYACTGFSGHGLMHGPSAGLAVSEEIFDGAAHTVDIAPLRWRTFGAGEYNVV
ncbi:MAG: FAD-binding oxidoreductase [Gemmatimonadetes bacterium]|nr:FAD-binding oxidoreductase [Gemmatimonadota bacterium]